MKYIKALIAFLLPILGKAVTRAVVDEVVKYAYPEDKPLTKRQSVMNVGKAVREADEVHGVKTAPGFETYHDVVMVAFDITGQSREAAYRFLCDNMPVAKYHVDADISIDSWWIADDEFDGSDCDSAVFVPKGRQGEAREFLGRNFPTDPQD